MSRVEELNPDTGSTEVLLRLPRSMWALDSVPSPNGRMVAMRAAGCATSFLDDHIVVRNLRSGRQWSIGADAVRCHELTTPAWSPDDSKLVFAYGPSTLPTGTRPSTSPTCDQSRPNELVIASATHASSSGSWRLIPADRGCSYQGAAFDHDGIAAVEGCGSAPAFGHVYLLQLSVRGGTTQRVALKPGWEEGLVATQRSGDVLVTQDQPANAGYPERDWVWEFDGHHIRPVAHYRAFDAAQVIAVPW
jgi:Tol biopolymer transport system component